MRVLCVLRERASCEHGNLPPSNIARNTSLHPHQYQCLTCATDARRRWAQVGVLGLGSCKLSSAAATLTPTLALTHTHTHTLTLTLTHTLTLILTLTFR